jgi:amino acid transporter
MLTAVKETRGMIVAVVGLVVLVAIVLAAFAALPGPVPRGQLSTKGENVVAIATAAIAATGSLVGAYFGVRSASAAREETAKDLRRQTIRLNEVSAATDETVAAAAMARAEQTIDRAPDL